MSNIKLTLEHVTDYLNKYDVEVISSEYVNTKTNLKLKCPCGDVFKRSFGKCKSNSPVCVKCTKELKKKDELNSFLKKMNELEVNVLFYEEYNYKSTKFKIQCRCGKEEIKSLKSLLKNPSCTTCAKRNCGKDNLSNSDIHKIIADNSECELISEDYSNRDSVITLKCSCKEVFNTYIDRFLVDNKRQCNKCGILRRSGKNNPNWRGGTSSKNDKIRGTVEYKKWRKTIFGLDDYSCQCCNDNTGGNLQAHHIDNFSDNLDKVFNIDNGITLCNLCHDFRKYGSFHHTYGTKGNNIYQLQEYFDDIRKHLNLEQINIFDLMKIRVKTYNRNC